MSGAWSSDDDAEMAMERGISWLRTSHDGVQTGAPGSEAGRRADPSVEAS